MIASICLGNALSEVVFVNRLSKLYTLCFDTEEHWTAHQGSHVECEYLLVVLKLQDKTKSQARIEKTAILYTAEDG